MIKFVLAGVWICAATIGAVFFAFQTSSAKQDSEATPPFFGGLDYVKTDVVSIPLMREGEMYGYFLARFVYTAEPEKLRKLSVPAPSLILDEAYSFLYGNPQIDFSQVATLDLDKLRNSIRDHVNARTGEQLIHDVLIEQVDYLSKEEIRNNAPPRKAGASN